MKASSLAFYAVVDAKHFLGAVALVNSLRAAGHEDPVHFYDCGLEAWQADILGRVASLEPAAAEDAPPHLLKLEQPLARPADVMVLVDADVLVLRPLEPLIAPARQGAIAAFADPVIHRFRPEWSEVLDLGPLRRGPYVNAGVIAVPRAGGLEVVRIVHTGQAKVDPLRTTETKGRPEDPFYYLDQDVWNAVLASAENPCEVEVFPGRLAPHPPFSGLISSRGDPLACEYADGTAPLLLHHVGRKPWIQPTFESPYTRLLSYFLLSPGLPVQVDPARVPLRLRSGFLAAVERKRTTALAALHSQRGRLGVRRWLAARRSARRQGAAV